MSSSALLNDNMEAQVSENTLDSIVNQTNVNALTRAQINVGENPIFIDAFGDAIYVANSGSDTVSVIDPNTNKVIDNIHVGRYPGSINTFYGPSGEDVIYVTNEFSETVSVIDPDRNTVIKNITVGYSPTFIDTFIDKVYVTNFNSNTVSVIDPITNTVIKNITVGENPIFIDALFHERSGKTIIYVANSGSNTVSVIDPDRNAVIKNITVGYSPSFISSLNDTMYVVNSESDTVSVIDPITNTVIKNITVGENPSSINTFEGNDANDVIYVANSESDTVSVIEPITNTVIKNITVGENPKFIHTYYGRSGKTIIYVANSESDTVSVIDPDRNAVIKNITVGEVPTFIYRFEGNDANDVIYVANSESDTVSVIEPLTNEEVASITFDIKPFRAGQIICNGLEAPINRILYVPSDAKCIAKPNKGFEFSSWTENLDQNSTITINASSTSGSPWTPFLDFFGIKLNDPAKTSPFTSFLDFIDVTSDDPASTFTVNRFGNNYTVYFRALPPTIPSEYWIPLYGIIVSTMVGWSIPSIISWSRLKMESRRLNYYHTKITSAYDDGELDKNDIGYLNILSRDILNAYSNGKLSNEHYTNLKNEISKAHQKIFKKRIESISVSDTEHIIKVKNDIKDAYSDGKIIELHYNLLNEQISDLLDKGTSKSE